jgi:hypothetical protein
MSSVVIAGDTSGTVTLSAPAVAGTTTLTLPSTSGNVVATSGGYVPTSQLASGTADSTTYLRGDQTWASVSSTPTTAQVLSATAGASAGAVGTYAFLGALSAFSVTVGTNYAGSSFVFAGFMISGQDWNGSANEATYGNFGGGSPSGTWKAMGQNSSASNSKGTLFLRVA